MSKIYQGLNNWIKEKYSVIFALRPLVIIVSIVFACTSISYRNGVFAILSTISIISFLFSFTYKWFGGKFKGDIEKLLATNVVPAFILAILAPLRGVLMIENLYPTILSLFCIIPLTQIVNILVMAIFTSVDDKYKHSCQKRFVITIGTICTIGIILSIIFGGGIT